MTDADTTDTDGMAAGNRSFAAIVYRALDYPLYCGIAGALIGFVFLLGLLPPAVHGPAAITAPVTIASMQEEAPPAAESAADIRQETSNPPPAAVSVVAEAAIVITDIGLNRRVTDAAAKSMPPETTMAVSVYATDPEGSVRTFRAGGHDVWLQLASQSVNGGIDPGPLAVSSNGEETENLTLLKRQVAMAGKDIAGVYLPQDSDMTADETMWQTLASDLIGDGLIIMDATKAKVATSLFMQRSESSISAYLKADVVLRGDQGAAELQKAMELALPVIIRQQQAIVILSRPTLGAVEAFSAWVKTLPGHGVRIVPASRFTGLKS